MVFDDILSRVEGSRRQLVFYNAEDHSEAVDRIIDYVGSHDADIEYATDETAEPTVVVRDGDKRLSVDEIQTVADYIDAWESDMTDSGELPSLFAALDETVFRSKNKRQLVLASRLIETRAVRVGYGQLSAGFQQLSLARPQLSFYQQLPEAITISLYGEADWLPPADSGIDCYDPCLEEHTDYWWVLFDGTDQPDVHAALLAEENSPGEYTGFWTYRQPIVEALRERVDSLDSRRLTN